jgi:large subunit ribosomal protein L9
MATSEIILREKIDGLGSEADVVKVRSGYARNFLVPQGKAFEATPANLRHIESLKAARAQREAEELSKAQELATKISKLRPKFTLEVGESGKAFGSVTSIDVHKELEAAGIHIDRTAIQLEKPIKRSGKNDVTIQIHPEISTTLTVNVEAHTPDSSEEA